MAEEEIRHKGGKRAHHETTAAAEHRAGQNADGRDRLEIRDGREQDAPRRSERAEHHRGHNLPQRRAVGLETGEEHAHSNERHHEGEQGALIELEQRRSSERDRHRHE